MLRLVPLSIVAAFLVAPPTLATSAHATPTGATPAVAAAPEAAPDRDDPRIGFARDPHIQGDRVVFTFRGDLWLVDADGANPRRLTHHEARDSSPRFSPDGRWIAFTSNRMGNNDVFIMPAEGGEARQLTFYSGGDDVVTWTPDSRRVVFTSGRGSLMWESQLYSVSVEGDLPLRMPLGAAVTGTYSPDGRHFAFNPVRYPDPKRHYRGSAAATVWVADLRAGEEDGDTPAFLQLTNTALEESQRHVHDAFPMFAEDGLVYFKSERDGTFNLWRIAPDGGEAEQVTRHDRGGVRFPSISPDGSRIVYLNDFDLWIHEVATGESRRVPVDLSWVQRANPIEFVSVSNQAGSFDPSPDGSYMAVDFRGEIFVVPTEEGVGERSRITESGWRQSGPMYSPDGKHLAYISDESGEQEVWLHTLETGERRRLTTTTGFKSLERWSPDSERIYFSAETSLHRVRPAGGQPEHLVSNRAGGVNLTHTSRDGDWIVYHRSDDFQNVDVYLLEVASGTEYNLTDHPSRNSGGVLTPEGDRLVFLSNRGSDGTQIYSVTLDRPTEDPDDPLVRERRRQGGGQAARDTTDADREEGTDAAQPARGGERAGAPARIPDLTDIGRRALQLSSGDDAVASFFLSNDGRSIYYVAGSGSSRGLHQMDIDGRNARRLAEGAFQSLRVTADGRMVFYRDGNAIQRMVLQNRNRSQVSFQLAFTVDKQEEWRQMFDEFYRYWKYSYVEEEMFGLDWQTVRARYEPMVDRIAETADFYDLAGEMLHEVPSSHSGISAPSGGGGGGSGGFRSRNLGFEMEPEGGVLRVTHIVRDGPADRPWLDLEEGHVVLALNGTPLSATENYWPLLNGLLNEYVTVTVADAPGGENRRDLRIRTTPNLSAGAYEDWVERNREFVDRETDGRIYYAHIRSMNQASLSQFEQELDENFHRQGIIIDVRFNGGGNIDQQLMDILQRRPYQYTWTRTGSPHTGRRPHQVIFGPQVMMHNWRSGSNAEMVPHAFRHLELGTLVGTPTNGAVVSASQFALKDGGSVRIPRVRVVSYDPEQPYNFGVNLENYGVPPDIWVRNTPEDQLRGEDRELRAAVEEALRLLGTGRWQYVDDAQQGGGGR